LSLISRKCEREVRSGREEEVRRLCAAESFLREGSVPSEVGREVSLLLETTIEELWSDRDCEGEAESLTDCIEAGQVLDVIEGLERVVGDDESFEGVQDLDD
jgi:hypothetical protein